MEMIIYSKELGTLRVVSSLALHSAKMSLFPSMMLIAVMHQYFDEDAKMKMTVMVIKVMMMLLNMRRR